MAKLGIDDWSNRAIHVGEYNLRVAVTGIGIVGVSSEAGTESQPDATLLWVTHGRRTYYRMMGCK